MRIFWRQFLTNFLIIALVLILFTTFTIIELKKHDKSLTKERLLTTDNLLREVIKNQIRENRTQEIDLIVSQIGEKTGIRITVIDKDGVVIGDSEKDPKVMENHANRPEVKDAISKGIGEGIRYSTTLKKHMFYVAVPIEDNTGKALAIVRTALPLISLEETFASIKSQVISLGLILTLLALILSYASSKAFTKLFEKSIRLSEQIAEGNFNVSVPISDRKGEIGKLNLALNTMAEKLDELFRQVSIEKSQLEAVLTAMSEGVMVVANDGKVILMNHALKDMLAIKDTPLGKPYWEVLRNREIMELIENSIKNLLSEKKEISLFYPTERYYIASAIPLGSLEKETIVVMFDITEFKRLEKIKADIVANVSHELRTPLTAIKGYVETLEEGAYENPDERSHFLNIIRRHTDRLINIVSDLLLLSEIERKSAPLKEEPKANFEKIDFKEIVYSSLEALKSKVEEKGLRVSVDIKENLPKFRGDGFLLGQMFINLVDNAVKYTPEGGTIGVEIKHPNSQFRIEVIDTGIGIPKEHLARIFERFYRVDKTRSRKVGGTGLGLSIVKHIVIMHGGKIEVESEVGKGSRFIITLPA
ncbi:MAG: HAMP domain-containing protein [Deltaproteobacteria bacterium]|nr:HAMP domain-containing protein [Deltaproteobacteria bacterium]